MNFRTQVELPKEETEIRHSDRIMLFGSCFAENIGNLLLANKFRCDVNPFGILYNPLSVAPRKVPTVAPTTDAGAMDAIKAAVEILTAGKGQVIKIEKL